MIKLDNISKIYTEEYALKDFSLVAEQGERIAITGVSGAGKTTILRIIMGLETATSGKLEVDKSLTFAAVFQEDRLLGQLDVTENITKIAGVSKELAVELLEKAGLAAICDKKIKELSGGEKRRVAILRAVTATSDVIIMDEPFKGLDPEARERIINIINEKAAKKTIIFSTHTTEEILLMNAKEVRVDKFLKK